MSKRIRFKVWGKRAGELLLACYALVREHETDIDAVVRSIERTTGLAICGGPSYDGTAMHLGKPTAKHYQMTLGRPVRGGGYSPEAELWVAIPVEVK